MGKPTPSYQHSRVVWQARRHSPVPGGLRGRRRLRAQWHLTFEPVWQVVDSLSLWGGQSCPQPAFKPAWRRVETRRRPGLAAPQRNPPSYAHSVLGFAGPFQKLSAIGPRACPTK
jgi:hypothetical protein